MAAVHFPYILWVARLWKCHLLYMVRVRNWERNARLRWTLNSSLKFPFLLIKELYHSSFTARSAAVTDDGILGWMENLLLSFPDRPKHYQTLLLAHELGMINKPGLTRGLPITQFVLFIINSRSQKLD